MERGRFVVAVELHDRESVALPVLDRPSTSLCLVPGAVLLLGLLEYR